MNSPRHRPLRLGTRGSPLALAQAGWIARQLRERCGQPCVVVTVVTPGDESTAPIERLGTTGVFTTTLRAALLRGAVDFVVHSCKDLPTAPVPGLQAGSRSFLSSCDAASSSEAANPGCFCLSSLRTYSMFSIACSTVFITIANFPMLCSWPA